MAKNRKKDVLDKLIEHHAYIEKYDDVIREHERDWKRIKKELDRKKGNHTLHQELKQIEKEIFEKKRLRFEVFVRLIIYTRNLKSYFANKKSGYGLAQLKSEMDIYLTDCKLRKVTSLTSLQKAFSK
jgi:hypothetical protein